MLVIKEFIAVKQLIGTEFFVSHGCKIEKFEA
jgi:hypothetical protein